MTRADHCRIDVGDHCLYIWEYAVRKGYSAGPTNQFIKNLKIKPTDIAKRSKRYHYKGEAIDHAARALRSLVGREIAEGSYSFLPVPCSKAAGDSDYDDRLVEILHRAFDGWNADIRPILQVRQSTQADHERSERMPYEALLQMTHLEQPRAALRSNIVILDDVLNSGKHFKVAQTLVVRAQSTATVLGLFLTRCARGMVAP